MGRKGKRKRRKGKIKQLKTPKDRPKKPVRKLFHVRKARLSLTCEWENCNFQSVCDEASREFRQHVEKHHPNIVEEVVLCLWSGCEFFTNDARELRRHLLYHAYHTKLKAVGKLYIEFKGLPQCQRDTKDVNIIPDVSQSFRCRWDGCTADLDDPEYYYKHARYHAGCYSSAEHTKRHCLWEGCSQVVRVMSVHVMSHTGERDMACSTCGSVFRSRVELVTHHETFKQFTEEEYRFACRICLRVYPSKRRLSQHVRVSHVYRHTCPHCSRLFVLAASLERHVTIQHTDGPALSLACSVCNKRFSHELLLERHVRQHEGDLEEVVCPVPGCGFRPRDLKQYRLRIHTQKKHPRAAGRRYACHLCPRQYRWSSTLTGHLKTRHGSSATPLIPRFRFRLCLDGLYRLETTRVVTASCGITASQSAGFTAPPQFPSYPGDEVDPDPDDLCQESDVAVFALTCTELDVPEYITTDEGREVYLPDHVREALRGGSRVVVSVQNDQLQLLGRTEEAGCAGDPDDPDSLVVVMENPSAADGPSTPGQKDAPQLLHSADHSGQREEPGQIYTHPASPREDTTSPVLRKEVRGLVHVPPQSPTAGTILSLSTSSKENRASLLHVPSSPVTTDTSATTTVLDS